MKSNQHHALLIEIVISVLCFALASTVLVRTFAAARVISDKTARQAAVLLEGQNLADSLYLSGKDVLLRDWHWEGNTFVREQDGVIWTVTMAEEQEEAGLFRKAVVTASYRGEMLITLPCSRFFPREGGRAL